MYVFLSENIGDKMKSINYLEQKHSRYKPLFKPYIKIRQNAQDRDKFSKLKKKKWGKQLFFYQKRLKRYKLRASKNHRKIKVSKYPSTSNTIKHKYRNYLQLVKRFSLYYGGISRKKLKNAVRQSKKNINIIKNKTYILELFESRLDTVLYKAKIKVSMRAAGQFINHGKVSVNDKIVKSKSYRLKPGDIVKVHSSKTVKKIHKEMFYSINNAPKVIPRFHWGPRWGQKIFDHMVNFGPIPPKHLAINYRTLQIVFLGIRRHNKLSRGYPYYINVHNLLQNKLD